ncbi:ECF-type sigma factor [Sphingomonas sp. ST-64]|uniref:ECF-type sigma factor n=1 Tax=Sphingomonas plantiphila TaxID=3163295 RepID=A0ABW8YNF9_9SPHN
MDVSNDPPRPAGYSDRERKAAADLLETHYDALIRIARSKRRRAAFGDTMQTMDLLHDGLARLIRHEDFRDGDHFLCAAALAMRHVVIDHSRRKLASKRAGTVAVDTVEELTEFGETPEQIVSIGLLMQQMETLNPRWSQIVDARYFAGMTEAEAAQTLGISERTVRRDWSDAREWLERRMTST